MNKSVAVGAAVAFTLGAVAFHSLTADTVGPATQAVVTKPMSPLQMMRRDRDAAPRSRRRSGPRCCSSAPCWRSACGSERSWPESRRTQAHCRAKPQRSVVRRHARLARCHCRHVFPLLPGAPRTRRIVI